MADLDPLFIPKPPSSVINETVGALLLGAFFTTLFYGILCQQCYTFFQRFNEEGPFLKYSVWALWLLGTAHLALTIHPVYIILVLDYGNLSIFAVPIVPWSVSGAIFLTTTSDTLVHIWFNYRLWILSGHNWILLGISAILVVLDFGAAFALGVRTAIDPNIAVVSQQFNWLFYLALTTPAVSDLYTALGLCYFMMYKRSRMNHRTSSILHFLMVYTINTGLLTSIVCFISMITHAAMPRSFVFIGVWFPLSGLYSNALLGSLNARDWFRRDTNKNHAIIPLSRMSGSSGGRVVASTAEGKRETDTIDIQHPAPMAICVEVDETKAVL